MKRLLLALTLLLTLAGTPARAASPCTTTSATLSQAVLDALQPGGVLCLRAGTFTPGLLVMRGDGTAAAPKTVQAYPGESVVWKGSGGSTAASIVVAQGSYWTVADLALDGAAIGAPLVVINSNTVGVTLANDDIRNGGYDGVEVRGQHVTITGSTIHNFNSGVPGSDAHCVIVYATADGFNLSGNSIANCSGDGIQAYYPNGTAAPVAQMSGTISSNTFTRGNLPYSENAIDIKQGTWRVTGNIISGYGLGDAQGAGLPVGGNPAVFIHKWARGVTVTGNHLHDATKGIELFGGSGADAGAVPSAITITGNTLERIGAPGYSYVFSIQGVTSWTITGNRLLANSAPLSEPLDLAPVLLMSNLPTPTPPATPSATATNTPTVTPTQTASPTFTPSPTATATPTAVAEPGAYHDICDRWTFPDGHQVIDCPG